MLKIDDIAELCWDPCIYCTTRCEHAPSRTECAAHNMYPDVEYSLRAACTFWTLMLIKRVEKSYLGQAGLAEIECMGI